MKTQFSPRRKKTIWRHVIGKKIDGATIKTTEAQNNKRF